MHINVSGVLRKYVEYRRNLSVDAPTYRTAIELLCADHPQLPKVLYAADGRISELHRLFINGEPATDADLDRPAASSDTLDIITAIAGGSDQP